MVTANATSRGVLTRNLAIGGALAALAAGALTMTDRAMAVAPPAPPVCALPSTVSVPKTVNTAIPDGGAAVQSTITVTNGPTVIRDVDVFTNIPHTATGDLRVTLSHGGKTVVLADPTVGAGEGPGAVASWDNVFAGTLWDDQAGDPVSDHPFLDDGPVSPLVPEGALAAFNGMNANGDWTLTVQDTAAQDTGTLQDWALTIAGQNQAPPVTTTSVSGPGGVAIPDNNTTGITRSVTVSGAKSYLTDVNLRTGITHTANLDLEVFLSHGGKTVRITTGNGGIEPNVFNGTLWDDQAATPVTRAVFGNAAAPTLIPEEALAPFIGMNPNGEWTIRVRDIAAGDTGNLNSWSLDVQSTDGCGTPPGPGPNADPNPPAPGGGTTTTPTVPQLPPGPVAKLKPRAVGLKLSGRDRRAPYVVKATGKVTAPRGRTCVGKVLVTVKAGKKVVSKKRVAVNRKCSYTAKFTFKKLPKGLPKSGKVTVSARFLGNAGLVARTAKARSVRLG